MMHRIFKFLLFFACVLGAPSAQADSTTVPTDAATLAGPSFATAREIMGKNFIGIPEVERDFGAISPADRSALQHIPFSKETLRACAATHVLVADVGSFIDFNLSFFMSTGLLPGEKFAEQTVLTSWRLIRKTPVDRSLSNTWKEQQALINPALDEIPSERQLVYMMILYHYATGEWLFKNIFVRTSSVVLSDGFHAVVGFPDNGGPNVYYWRDDDRNIGVWVASARKLPALSP